MDRKMIAVLIAGCIVGGALFAQSDNGTPAKKPRVKPKKFDKEESSRVFFDNVFDEVIGARPDLQKNAAVATSSSNDTPSADSSEVTEDSSATASGEKWSQVISSAAIENELKAIKIAVDRDVTTPSAFRGRGYEQCRIHFSIAATLFGIILEYDGDVRWKADAAAAREVFARTASNAKVGTPQVFNEAKQRKTELEDLLNGNGFAGKANEASNDWSTITDRSPLMLRLESGFEEVVRPATGSPANFKANKEALVHQAEIIAALATVLTRPGMQDGDDETYQGIANQMRSAARSIVDAAQQDNYEQVRAAVGVIDQACTSCHDTYR